MEYIADIFWKQEQKIIVYSFIEQHGRAGPNGDWYLVKHNYTDYFEGIYLWEDGKFHFSMEENGKHHYFETQQEARNCCVKYGYKPVDY